ncbi:pyrophosphate--fructose 6-phosphate 1-phosphotransferase subunit beta-like [Cornus florida]|uniref:pyrophosphate--fructose 6-phosphate 1-phosphotransferase subunit beta-like n=1 Tax=Cornus florida TaxID=4283 RepID=UPI00289E3101|nr:pyrophosphate--fructose 6-phosphate 1-phosphotransferase subunit beta-like [Cornus florida]
MILDRLHLLALFRPTFPALFRPFPRLCFGLLPALFQPISLVLFRPFPQFLNSAECLSGKNLKIGVVLSGAQAPGGHNVISGIFHYLQDRCKGSTLYGFRGGLSGIMKCKYVELNSQFIYPYRNQGGFDMIRSGRDKIETPEQFQQAE